MPRPKRTKVAPSLPAPRPRNSMRVNSSAPEPTSVDARNIDDAADIFARGVRNANNKGKGRAVGGPQRYAKGLGVQELAQDETSSGVKNGLESTQSAFDAQKEQNNAETYADESSLELEVSRREPASGTGSFGRARHSSFVSRAVRRGRSSSVESNLEYNGLTSIGGRSTPSLATSSFARRQRQSSVTGRGYHTIGSSSMGTPAHVGSAMKLGGFRRRAREPSILGTARKEQRPRPDSDLDDEEEFNPDDESTPLNLSKTRTTTGSSNMSGSISRKRKLSTDKVPSSSPTVQSPREPQEVISTGGHSSDEDDEPENSVLSSPQESPIPSIEARPLTPLPMSPTMAPPQSTDASSSPELPTIRRPVSRGRRILRGRTPAQRTQESPVSSPPSLTHSPNRHYVNTRITQAKEQPPPPSTYSTAQLQALLPRRRRHATRDPFDIPISEDEVDTSGLASDDDELSFLNARARSRRNVLTKTLAGAKKTSKSRPAPKPMAKSVKRIYGLRAQADKENGALDPDDSLAPLPDDGNNTPENVQVLDAKISNELKMAARKFEEVDKWELEFEDVTASSSSPKDAR